MKINNKEEKNRQIREYKRDVVSGVRKVDPNRGDTKETFIKKAREVEAHKNKPYTYDKVIYTGCLIKVEIGCGLCNKTFWQRPFCHLYGNGCPICGSSKGEQAIVLYLTKAGIDFTRQKTFDGLVSDKGYLLKCDFFAVKKKCRYIIEFDGIQHRKHVPGMMTYEGFIRLQGHDKLKNKYAKNHNIIMIRITKKADIPTLLKSI